MNAQIMSMTISWLISVKNWKKYKYILLNIQMPKKKRQSWTVLNVRIIPEFVFAP